MTTALLIIDVQNAILDGKSTPERESSTRRALDATVQRLAAVQARARQASVPVILIQHDGEMGHRLERGTDGWDLRPEIAPQDGDLVVHKRFSDSFFETRLHAQLVRLGIEHLAIGGCMTQFCVDTTVRRAVSMGYNVTLLSDGHTTADANGLGFDQIVTHHNHLLDGFEAGQTFVRLAACEDMAFECGMT
ncbi:MAG: isochorismatase family protein [Asticcacaulis sp.]|uniref:isochorismatase family protein n=1 Tax=Asticcacaulis sp. TaxID=1872648 RepID=UPI0039E39D9B